MTYKFNADGWTNWIAHDGKGCPCVGWYCQDEHYGEFNDPQIKILEGITFGGGPSGGSWDWSNYPKYTKIIRYRIRKPKGAELLTQLAADTDMPVKEEA